MLPAAALIVMSLPAEKKKKAWKGISGGMYAAYAQTKTTAKNTEETVKIQLTEKKIVACKHKFGIDYMDLVEQNASDEELAACVGAAKEEIARLKGKLHKYETNIATNKQKMETKIAKRKGGPMPHTQPSIEVTDAAESVSGNSSSEAATSSSTAPTGGGDGSQNSPFPEATSASFSVASSSRSVNPFDDEDLEKDKKPSAAAPTASSIETDNQGIPIAKAVPVSETNNPFGVDKEETAASVSTNTKNVNPFNDEKPAAASKPPNAFDDDERPAASSKPPNPFDDDDVKPAAASKPPNPFDDDKPSKSSNPFDC
jgi:hypothetical protein